MAETRCIFCRIVAGDAEAAFVHQGDQVVAFMDTSPVTPGHLLVVPRDHHPSLADLPQDTAGSMFTTAQTLAGALRATDIQTDGINLWYADGAAAMQSVFHAHLHVIPRFRGDGFTIQTARWTASPGRDELAATAASIRTALDG